MCPLEFFRLCGVVRVLRRVQHLARILTLLLGVLCGVRAAPAQPVACPFGAWHQAADGPGERVGASMTFDSTRQVTVLFGGGSGGVFSHETWEYDGTTWSLRSDIGPSARVYAGMVYDSQHHRMVLFGGGLGNGLVSNETWAWDGRTWTLLADDAHGPAPARLGAALAYDSGRDRVVLFGGLLPVFPFPYFNDLWEWDGATWSPVEPDGTLPPPGRYQHAMAYDPQRGSVVMFGGYNGNLNFLNDTWEWYGASRHWLPITGPAPGARGTHVMAYVGPAGGIVMNGGGPGGSSDTWFLDSYGLGWQQLLGPAPPPRQAHMGSFDSARGKFIIYGGTYGLEDPINLRDVWEYDVGDTDGDGIRDCWESQGGGIDFDRDGVIDLSLYDPPYNARPDHKDVFVEVDAMNGLAPKPRVIESVIAAFAAAPANLVHNPDGTAGITLHVFVDETNLLNEPWDDVTDVRSYWPVKFDIAKAAHFGTPAERANPALLHAKAMVFRYCIFADTFARTDWSGNSEIGGNDFLVAVGAWGGADTADDQAGTFMHELGHTLGLHHGGNQIDFVIDSRYNWKPNYHSVMNYTWQFPLDGFTRSWSLGYSTLALPTLDESNLAEADGIRGAPGIFVQVGPPPAQIVRENGAVDWNRDGDTNDAMVAADINHIYPPVPASPGDTLEGYTDWPNLDYCFRDSPDYADGSHTSTSGPTEMPYSLLVYLDSLGCRADWNSSGTVNSQDLFDFITDFFNASADVNQDLVTNSQDFFDYLVLFFEGC